MFYIYKGAILCEEPEWGRGPTRCSHIGFYPNKEGFVCVKFGQTLGELDGWQTRCDACANGGYEPRDEEALIGKVPPVVRNKKIIRKPRPWSGVELRVIRSLSRVVPVRELLLKMLSEAKVPVTKSTLIKEASGLFFDSYVSNAFVYQSGRVKTEFDTLVAEGVILYTKGKPLQINKGA